MSESYILEMKNISKTYTNTRVLNNIDLKVKAGEIHCLVGENGAGKSTLMNVLFGMSVISSTGGFDGEVLIEGKKVDIKSPKQAMEYGIGMVHQEFMLIPAFSITENIKLNRETLKNSGISKYLNKSLKSIDIQSMNKDARIALDTLNLTIEEFAKVSGLPVGYKQFIEIAREIDKKNIKLLVFDEPTAVLSENEAESLLQSMKKLAGKGVAILFITHRLDEVMKISDRITILRDGELVCHKETKDTSVDEIAELMVGRKINLTNTSFEHIQANDVMMSLHNLEVNMPGEQVKGIDLDIYEGEILGIGGLAGHGKIGIANGIMGLYPTKGEITYKDKPYIINDTYYALKNNIAFVSEDRKGVGLVLDESIGLNMVFTALSVNNEFLYDFKIFRLINRKAIRKHAQAMIDRLDIRCEGVSQKVGRLSGGNQQKVCIAKALTQNPKLLFVSEPTRGIDIGAKKRVLDLLIELNKDYGMTIVMTSSELAELRSVCNRIAIISEGKISGILKPNDSSKKFGLLMSGLKLEEEVQ